MRSAYSVAAILTLALLLPVAAHAANPQSKMKMCADQYHEQKIPKHEYRSFMSRCLKKDSARAAPAPKLADTAAPAVTVAAPAPQQQDDAR